MNVSKQIIAVVLGCILIGCGPFLNQKSSSRGLSHSSTFHIARATNATTAGVTTQSTSPLRMWEGGIANLTTASLTFNKLVFHLQTDLSANELRERNPRVSLQFGSTTRTVNVAISETGTQHEVQFLNLNTALAGNINQERPSVQTIEDIQSLPAYARTLVLRLLVNGKPHKPEGTTFTLTLVKAETKVQQPGVLLETKDQTPNVWPLLSPGYTVTWIQEDSIK